MLGLFRKVHFPEQLQTSGPLVKASMLHHVKNYEDLIAQAEQRAAQIIAQAEGLAEQIKRDARQQIAQSMQEDLSKLKKASLQKEQALQRQISSICIEICMTIVEQFIDAQTDRQKVSTLIDALLSRAHSVRELHLLAHPNQVDLVNDVLSGALAEQFNLKKWHVVGSDEVSEFELRISSTKGSEIQVSLKNLIELYQEEVNKLRPSLEASLPAPEVDHESMV